MRVTKAFALLSVALASLAGVPLAAAAVQPSSPTVTIADGTLAGASHGDVVSFLGIPYAAPPVGPNRWRAPQAEAAWKGVRPATAYSASCMQPYPAPAFGPYTLEFLDTPPPSEDCLYLNVWRPAHAPGPLPVLVWIHGGGFLGGSGAMSIYSGAHLAAKNVVVVSINYRLGPLGYLAHPALTAENGGHGSGNYGTLDQIAALRWVRENIAAFGGDPKNVTVAGQSAGAISVNNLMIAPAAAGLFAHAIAESGSGIGPGNQPLAEAEANGVVFANYLGAHTAADLRALPASAVQAAVYLPIAPGGGEHQPPELRFLPVVDGYVLPEDSSAGTSRPRSNVPFLTGFNADEETGAAIKTTADLIADARRRYGAHADRILALYPHDTDAESVASAKIMARDRYMASLVVWTNARARTSGQTIFRYMYDHATPAPAGGQSFGSFHTAEVPYVFGVLDRSIRPYGAVDDQVSDVLQGYWLNFIEKGDPNGASLPVWQTSGPSGDEVMVLDERPHRAAVVSSPARLEAFKSFAADGGDLTLF